MLNNQRKNVKNKNERSEVDVLSGFSVYHDDKNRTIYYNRLNHRGYVIKRPRLCRHAVQVFFLFASVHDGR